jgi:hypothetical protein
MVRVDEKQLLELAMIIANTERELALKKVALQYAIADIPHSCYFCMSNRYPNIECNCEGCENSSHWSWYGLMGV